MGMYNVTSLPYCLFIKDGELDTEAKVTGEVSLRSYLSKVLK